MSDSLGCRLSQLLPWRWLGWLCNFEFTLNAYGLRLHHRRLWCLNRVSLDVHWGCLHLFGGKSMVEALAEWTHRYLLDVNIDVFYLSHDWLVLWVLNTFERPQHYECILRLFILVNSCHGWVVVLLVTQKDVVEKRTLAWQESTRNVKGFDVPIFLFEFLFFLNIWLHESGAWLDNESELGGDTEVGHDKELELLKEGFSGELTLVSVEGKEISHSYWLDLHDVPDIEI